MNASILQKMNKEKLQQELNNLPEGELLEALRELAVCFHNDFSDGHEWSYREGITLIRLEKYRAEELISILNKQLKS